MQKGLLFRTNNFYILSGIALYLILFVYWHFPFSIYNALILLNFAAFAVIVYRSLLLKDYQRTTRRLALTVFCFSTIFVSLYMMMSYHYTGNTFIFSEHDARLYEELSYRIKDLPKKDIIYYLTVIEGFAYDDWGAPIVMSYLLKIVPAKEFLNLSFIVLNTISACMLFSIGKSIMSKEYAYTGTLAYSIASYTMFFMGSFLKEILLLFMVISCFYCLYRHKSTKSSRYIVIGLIVSGLILFFRPVVAFGIWLSFLTYYIFVEKRKVLVIFFSIFGIFIAYLAFRLIVDNLNRYNSLGEGNFVTYSVFDRLVFILSALIGPFPHLLKTEEITFKPLYGSGLMYKLLLFYAFWKGTLFSIKKKEYDVLPLIAFAVLESVGLIVAIDSLELRKALPHIPAFILVAFWYLYRYDTIHQGKLNKTGKLEFTIYMSVAFLLALAWNTLL